jgi:mRNA-degrading endonuclease RelE of RelBE toxin-antitoxin system
MSDLPPFEVRLRREAARELRRLDSQTRRRIDAALRHEAARVGDPHGGRGGKAVKLLRGQHERIYRLRVGTWRVLSERDHEQRILRVDAIVPRRDLERWLRDHSR